MESYAENDLIDHLMAFLHETYEKEPMGMVIDCDVNVPKRLTGDLQTTQQEILQKIQEVLSYGKTRLLVIRLTYERSLPTGNLLVLIQTHPVRDQGQAPHEMMGRTETLVLPQLLVEEGPLVTCKEPCQLIGYYERQQNTDAGEQQAYLITQEHLAKQMGLPFVLCGTIQHLQAELQKKREVCLMLSMAQYEVHQAYFSHLPEHVRLIVFCRQGHRIEERTNQIALYVPFSSLELADAIVSPLPEKEDVLPTLDASVGRLYCGNDEIYHKILKDYALRGKHNWVRIEELFAKQDWDNYRIEVHGIKSSMKAIGAMELSEEAKALEAAGKEGDILYILSHHEKMMQFFIRDIHSIQAYFDMPLSPRKDVGAENEESASVNLSEAEKKELLTQLEDAAYGLDGQEMLRILQPLEASGGFVGLLQEVERKIDSEDYLSAYDLVEKRFT